MPEKIQPLNRDLLVRNCPFCHSWRIYITHILDARYFVSCDDCGGEMPGPSFERKSWRSAAEKVAAHLSAIRAVVALWNCRRGETTQQEVRPAHLDCNIVFQVGKDCLDLGGVFGWEKGPRHSHIRPGARAKRFHS
jgi:hypothetical protein